MDHSRKFPAFSTSKMKTTGKGAAHFAVASSTFVPSEPTRFVRRSGLGWWCRLSRTLGHDDKHLRRQAAWTQAWTPLGNLGSTVQARIVLSTEKGIIVLCKREESHQGYPNIYIYCFILFQAKQLHSCLMLFSSCRNILPTVHWEGLDGWTSFTFLLQIPAEWPDDLQLETLSTCRPVHLEVPAAFATHATWQIMAETGVQAGQVLSIPRWYGRWYEIIIAVIGNWCHGFCTAFWHSARPTEQMGRLRTIACRSGQEVCVSDGIARILEQRSV